MSTQLAVVRALHRARSSARVRLDLARASSCSSLGALRASRVARQRPNRGGRRLSIVELPARLEPDGGRTIAPGGVGALRALRRARSSPRSAWISTRPGTRETPRRFLRAMFDATAGYDGDPKLRTAFPSERPRGVDGAHSQIVEGPISFFSLCEHHALPFHGVAHVGVRRRRRDPRHLEADAARPALRAPLHGAGAARRADRRHARRARARRAASPCTSRRRTSARRCAASRRRARAR